MHKTERQKLILDLIAERTITRQDEIAQLLRERGAEVTQASVSRDLDELDVVKVDGRYTRVELTPKPGNPFGVVSIEPSGDSLLVVRCASGLASAVAVRIDAAEIDEVVGTLAGDDTIFVAVRYAASQKVVLKRLKALFAEG